LSSKVEKLENNIVKITFEITPEQLEAGMQFAYNKNKGQIKLTGFRPGKVPRNIIENVYGPGFFYDDALNHILPDVYEEAVSEHNLDTVSKPEIDVTEISKETGATIVATVTVKPEVEIENYKDIEVTKEKPEATEEEINAQLDAEREKNSRTVTITDRPIKDGDIATIDFEGFVDDVAFEGGKGTDYDLTIGSKTFIDTFEEQLIGANVGDDLDVNVTFPQDYGKEDLAGKPALFKIEIKDIKAKELPDLTDDFAQDVSEFDTLDEYKNDIKAKILERKEQTAERAMEEELLKKLTERAKIDLPDVMVDNRVAQMVHDFKGRITQQGIDFDMYLQYIGKTMEEIEAEYKENAEFSVRVRLILEKIAEIEAIEATEEDIDAEMEKIAQMYQMDKENIKNALNVEGTAGLIADIKTQKALEMVKEAAKI